MKVTYYLEVISSWCYWSEPTWAELKRRYAGQVDFDWKIALMRREDWPVSRAQCEWFYRRSGLIVRSPFMLSAGWWEPFRDDPVFPAASFVAEAARDLGFGGDEVRLALSHAADREGVPVASLEPAVAVAAKATGLDPVRLRERAQSAEVRARIEASTQEFFAHRIDQRPAYVITDDIGDKAVFSGLVRIETLAATIDAMLADQAAYGSHRAHFGGPPPG